MLKISNPQESEKLLEDFVLDTLKLSDFDPLLTILNMAVNLDNDAYLLELKNIRDNLPKLEGKETGLLKKYDSLLYPKGYSNEERFEKATALYLKQENPPDRMVNCSSPEFRQIHNKIELERLARIDYNNVINTLIELIELRDKVYFPLLKKKDEIEKSEIFKKKTPPLHPLQRPDHGPERLEFEQNFGIQSTQSSLQNLVNNVNDFYIKLAELGRKFPDKRILGIIKKYENEINKP